MQANSVHEPNHRLNGDASQWKHTPRTEQAWHNLAECTIVPRFHSHGIWWMFHATQDPCTTLKLFRAWNSLVDFQVFIFSNKNYKHRNTFTTGYRVQVFAWFSIAQSVFGLLAIRCLRLPSFEFCIRQRKTTCLLSIRNSLASARASELTTNMYNARARCESQPTGKSIRLNARSSQGRTIEFKFFAW